MYRYNCYHVSRWGNSCVVPELVAGSKTDTDGQHHDLAKFDTADTYICQLTAI